MLIVLVWIALLSAYEKENGLMSQINLSQHYHDFLQQSDRFLLEQAKRNGMRKKLVLSILTSFNLVV
jgi:hypothetical protein